MTEAVAERAVEVRTVVQRVHLVHADGLEIGGRGLDASSSVTGSPLASGTMRSAPGPTWSSTALAGDGSTATGMTAR